MTIYNTLRGAKDMVVGRLLRFWREQSLKIHQRELLARCSIGDRTILYLTSSVENQASNPSLIAIGSDTHVRGNLHVFPHGGKIVVGSHVYIGDLSRIWSMSSIAIGNRVLISHNVNIHDHIAHSLSAADRHEHFAQIIEAGHPSTLRNVTSIPVVIEDDVWIGFNATVLKGVRIGRGAVVGACAVVTKDVAPYTVVVGNPARVVGASTP